MKYFILALALSLMACSPASTEDDTSGFIMPEELKDCRMIKMQEADTTSKLGVIVYVMKCPDGYHGATTHYMAGKVEKNITTIVP